MQTINDLKVLEGLEGVRKRPEMYLGKISIAKAAYFHALQEIVDNGSDEYLAGRCKKIRVAVVNDKKYKCQTFIVADDGGGIPIEKHPKTGESGIETVFGHLHAGGKFESKKASRGTHGVGSSVVNALSKKFESWTYRDGKWYYVAYKQGVGSRKLTKEGKKKFIPLPEEMKRCKKGTIVRYTPDAEIFGRKKLKKKWLKTWFTQLTYLCPGLKIVFQWDDEIIKFDTTKGLEELIKNVCKEDLDVKPGKIFHCEDKDLLDIVLTWTNLTKSHIMSYVNSAPTQAGTHVVAVNKCISQVLMKLKKSAKQKFDAEDLRIGLVGVIHAKVLNPEFDGQVKDDLTTTVEFQDLLKKELTAFFKKNKSLANKIIAQASEIAKAKESLKKRISIVKKASKSKRGVLPNKLIECDPSVPVEKRELFLLEGDSAGGSAKNARYKHQEILKLKGKFFNAMRTSPSKFFDNDTVKDILIAIGTGIGDECDPTKMRVGKVLSLTDADEDGSHIAALILAYGAEYLEPIINAGKLYVVDAPLFSVRFKGKKYYANKLKVLARKIKKANGGKAVDIGKLEVVRMKGWAEAPAEDLRELAFNPKTRKLLKITKIDRKEKEMIVKVMGSDTSFRKKLLNLD